MDPRFLERIYEVIRRIPPGRVATYGQIASLAGKPRHARHVGNALKYLPDDSSVPWHRVVNAAGGVSRRSRSDSHELQRILLESEGVAFGRAGRISLEQYRWDPDDRPRDRAKSRPRS